MASNKGFIMNVKNNNGRYTEMFPVTTREQILGWDIGDVFGPFDLTLRADSWQGNKQVLDLVGVEDTDILYCTKVLKGTKAQKSQQELAYKKLSPVNGIQSLRDKVQFTCDSVPEVDINVQVWWTR